MKKFILSEIDDVIKNLESLKCQYNKIIDIAEACIFSIKSNNKIIFCGNGGSAAQAQHLVAELIGRYKKDRSAIAAMSLTVDTSNITAIGNDYGFNDIFRRQLEGVGKKGDVLIGLSTSGNSRNVIQAFEFAKNKEIKTISFIGMNGGILKNLSDLYILIPSFDTNHIQEMHIIIGHMICDIIEREINSTNII